MFWWMSNSPSIYNRAFSRWKIDNSCKFDDKYITIIAYSVFNSDAQTCWGQPVLALGFLVSVAGFFISLFNALWNIEDNNY